MFILSFLPLYQQNFKRFDRSKLNLNNDNNFFFFFGLFKIVVIKSNLEKKGGKKRKPCLLKCKKRKENCLFADQYFIFRSTYTSKVEPQKQRIEKGRGKKKKFHLKEKGRKIENDAGFFFENKRATVATHAPQFLESCPWKLKILNCASQKPRATSFTRKEVLNLRNFMKARGGRRNSKALSVF